jgi:hypothetical protein
MTLKSRAEIAAAAIVHRMIMRSRPLVFLLVVPLNKGSTAAAVAAMTAKGINHRGFERQQFLIADAAAYVALVNQGNNNGQVEHYKVLAGKEQKSASRSTWHSPPPTPLLPIPTLSAGVYRVSGGELKVSRQVGARRSKPKMTSLYFLETRAVSSWWNHRFPT